MSIRYNVRERQEQHVLLAVHVAGCAAHVCSPVIPFAASSIVLHHSFTCELRLSSQRRELNWLQSYNRFISCRSIALHFHQAAGA